MARLCLQEIARERRTNQTTLCKQTGLSAKVVSNYWHNRIRRISLDILEKMGTALGVHATSLLTDLPLSQTQTKMRQKRTRRKEANEIDKDHPVQETPTTTPLVEERC